MNEFVDDRNPAQGDDPPVTAVASRQVKPGSEQQFEEWVSGILAAANTFPGYLGSEVLRSNEHDDNEYKIVFRFDRASNLHAWENSEERHRWLRKSRPLLYEEEKVQVLTGLETWFTLPSKPGEPAPPRYKMAIVTWLAVFPVVTVIFSLFGNWLNLLPTLVRTLVFTTVMVTLMTYVIMPRMTRLFSFWLYPDRK
ncbi:MAG: antibiotic biosynthesis monooxygenase [Actinobacteria bacterium]|nr:antibiotic biosynthesis monooxygenase [Actinomycetota bacterium]